MLTRNEQRAEKAQEMLDDAGYSDGLELSSAMSECLIDLRHLARTQDLDFDAVLECSAQEFEAELTIFD